MRTGIRGDIQGLRAVAVLAVLLDHTGIPGFAGGFVGVDVFFVISGFLITGQLLRERATRGRIDLPAFYARRARRLLPAALVVITLTMAASLLLMSPLRLAAVAHDAVAAALYVPNIRFAALQTDYLAGSAPSPFQHYWSLGVEEQFYLLWPVTLLGLALLAERGVWRRRHGRGTRHGMTLLVALAAVASLAACLFVAEISQPWAFFSLPTRAWELLAGALVACAATPLERVPRAIAAAGSWAGLAAIGAGVLLLTAEAPWPGPLTLLPTLGTAAVIALSPAAGALGPARALSLRPLTAVGALSYSLYLVHWPMVVLAGESLTRDGSLPLPAGVAIAIGALPVAWLLHRVVEEPLRRPRTPQPDGSLPARRSHTRTLAAFGALSLATAAALGGAGAAVAALPIDAGRSVTAPATLPELPEGTAFVPTDLRPPLPDAAADTGEIYDNGCQQDKFRAELLSCTYGDEDGAATIALFGDSHAGRLFPAVERVAEQTGARLVTYTKSGCRTLDTPAAWEGTDDDDCTIWRRAALAALAADAPDVIVLANHVGPMPGRDPQTIQRDWEEGIARVLAQLPEGSVPVLVHDNPELPFSAPLCLAAHVDDASACAVSRAAALNPAVRAAERAVAARTGAVAVDLTDWMCNAETCPAIIGDVLVYSDDHHLTATFGAALADPLGRALAPLLAADAGDPRAG